MSIDEVGAEQREEYVRKAISSYNSSGRIAGGVMCSAYYDTDNPEILKRRKVYASSSTDADGNERAVLKENRFASNTKICSSFFRDITDSKVQYLLGNGADITAKSEDGTEVMRAISDELGDSFRRVEQECLTDALIYSTGYAYMQVIEGRIVVQHIPYLEVIPHYNRMGELESVIRYYKHGGVEYAELHTPLMVYTYKRDKKDRAKSGWKYEGERYQIVTAMQYPGEVVTTGGKGWPRLPWFEMQQNTTKTSSLTTAAKSMIDCYDLTVSDFANNLIDIQDVFINIKDGYGSGSSYGEIMDTLKAFKITEGDNSVTTVEVPYLARQVLLTEMKQDIYAALRGVDVGRISGGNLTNTAIRALYSDVDNWADQAEWWCAAFVRSIVREIAEYMGVILPEYRVTFTRNMIVNVADELDAVGRQKGIVSDMTLYENHPWITDAAAEVERVAADGLPTEYLQGADE